ncbi:2239_t:CDS:2 [Acaulospora morrowiae]|uniref:Type 1 phosphatases regulator n=1 Tax=Acaulospora morrowiae TaxID=94023 RepID=A0A9N8VFS7_9GLOM|nr:2239_t:CDS:2 [Acaulospora morrowiae]
MAAGDSLRYRTRTTNPPGPPATYGSRTMTIHPEELAEVDRQDPSEENSDQLQSVGTLKLRGGGQNNRKVKWDNGVVDNEGMGKKKSKICCIYHKPKRFDESSSDESSSDSEDSDHEHEHQNGSDGGCRKSSDRRCRSNSPNAYERQPQYKNRPKPINQTTPL